jgi:hypothetical protein
MNIRNSRMTLPSQSSHKVFSGVRVTRSLVLCVMFCRSLFVLLSCLSFFDLRILIIPFVSSNSGKQNVNVQRETTQSQFPFKENLSEI